MSEQTDLARDAIQAGRILSSAGVFMNSPDVENLDLQTNSPTVHRTTFCPGVGAARMLGTATDNSYQLVTHINVLPGSGYGLKKPILVMLKQETGGEWLAVFPDAELSRTGDTPEDAINWVRSSIVTMYELFKKNASNLGPFPARQYRVLGEYLVKKSNPKT